MKNIKEIRLNDIGNLINHTRRNAVGRMTALKLKYYSLYCKWTNDEAKEEYEQLEKLVTEIDDEAERNT